ncbi:sensor histidine kinase RegB [Pseudooceanicola nanhaiensis]|jgi:two-component system sensor histidine kinase RegB|uniref:histidine kinase n=1 Tax=Pseudooceanicola nanhaiensis TaxID=375761 RepID=A0A917T3S0_9RHOB|nr:ActS/PrrB/RegB family redox-sensitive histidine kinase [Pseudooceanicola nanhaiensis]GGM08157.1 sensor histidine kinase RegB [Pseudooceanicola nanhaiensis]
MSHPDIGPLKGRQRGNWIRLRTIILLRWGAIAGQLSALLAAGQIYGLQLEYGLCYLVVGVSIAGNLIATVAFPESKRLTEVENLMMVLFDLLQLSLLLYLTGGLHNPFSILIVGPVTVSAAALSARSATFVGLIAITAATLLVPYHLPLLTADGNEILVADVFVFGSWLAIVIAVIFLGIYSRWIAAEMHNMSDALQATQMALAREQKLTDLGGVVAAAAHELGTPLATIKLTAAELAEDLDDRPDMQEDARLIAQQADRCRDILRSMGRAGKEDLHLQSAPLTTVVMEAAEPHLDRGKQVHFEEGPAPGHDGPQPVILRRPEVVHGLRNLIQNAVDFARANIWIEARWTGDTVWVRIMDDGRGYSPQVIGRIGDPFVRRRRGNGDSQRPGYEGMGLGLFIAKTLLERSGAALTFANGAEKYEAPGEFADRTGAVVEVTWPRRKIDAVKGDNAIRMRENRPLEI